MRKSYDAIIVGGGPAGAAAGIVLGRAGWRVAIVEQHLAMPFKVGEGLIPAARRVLAALGAPLDMMEAAGHIQSYGNASAWDGSGLLFQDFVRSIDGHGWHLDRGRFDEDMLRLAEENEVEVLRSVRLHTFERDASQWRLELKAETGNHQVTGSWLLDATGRIHTVARWLGVERHYLDTQLGHWLAFDARIAGDEDSLSLVESVDGGWWYTARLPHGRRIAVFFAPAGSALSQQAQGLQGYMELLFQTEHVADLLARWHYLPLGTPQATDARSSRLQQFHGDGWVAIGDAAMAFDPLSSQGIFTALYGGMKAAEAIVGHAQEDAMALIAYADRLENIWKVYLEHRERAYAIR